MATSTAVRGPHVDQQRPQHIFTVTRGLGGVVENAKVNVGKLYLRQIPATGLGITGVNNWVIYDGPGSEANLVAKGQGMQTYAAGNLYNWFTVVFEVQRFKRSTLQVMGASVGEENEWAIVGGTGEFAMARGIIKRRECHIAVVGIELTQELTMEFFCRMTVVPAPTKSGPWGGSGGSLHEMEGKSQRLESVTIHSGGKFEAIQFSYIDVDGKVRTAGFWGEMYGPGSKTETIKFGPLELVKQITGEVRDQRLCKFKIITNYTTYGPFGSWDGSSPFSHTVPEDKTVVGFFAKADQCVRSIGVYTI